MTARSWIRRQRDRPIAEHERHAAMAAVVVLLATVAVLLALTQPVTQASRAAQRSPRSAETIPGATVERHTLALTHEMERVAEGFLAGYLAYTYGRAPASRIAGASRPLIRSLQAHPPRVPPAARARHPRVLSLHPAASAAGEVAVSAVVNDGGLIDYSVGLVLASEGGRLLVTGVEGA
jgi:hypothetical protein